MEALTIGGYAISVTWLIVFFAIIVPLGVIHISTALVVMSDAMMRQRRGEELWPVGALVWGFATLFGGLFIATCYHVIHRRNEQAWGLAGTHATRGDVEMQGPEALSEADAINPQLAAIETRLHDERIATEQERIREAQQAFEAPVEEGPPPPHRNLFRKKS